MQQEQPCSFSLFPRPLFWFYLDLCLLNCDSHCCRQNSVFSVLILIIVLTQIITLFGPSTGIGACLGTSVPGSLVLYSSRFVEGMMDSFHSWAFKNFFLTTSCSAYLLICNMSISLFTLSVGCFLFPTSKVLIILSTKLGLEDVK